MEYVLSIIGVPQYSLKRAFAPLGSFAAHIRDHFIPHARNNYHPHLLGHRSLALMSGLLVAVKIFTLTAISLGPVDYAFSSAITQENIINLTNESRQQFGLGALTQNSVLDKAAQAKADDMLAKGYFSHNTPDGRTPWSFIAAVGYGYLMAGENLAVNFSEAENVETAWMNSPGHKANILNKNFVEIGIGIAEGTYQDHTAIFVVQMFGVPADQKVALADKPTKVRASEVPAPAAQVVPAANPPVIKAASSDLVKAVLPSAPVPANAGQPRALGDSQNKIASPAPEPVAVNSGEVKLDGGSIIINANVSGPAAKVLVYFGQQAIMLSPKSGSVWSGRVASTQIASTNNTVTIKAFDINGQSSQIQLADFSAGTIENYNLSGTAPASTISFLGLTFNPKVFENRFYLFFIAIILSSMVLAIAIKRHVQHLSLIANSSFVAIFAVLMYMVR